MQILIFFRMPEKLDKHINDLHIQNFGCFEDIKISGLKKINIVFGANSTGKTWLLRAIDLLLHNQNELTIYGTLYAILQNLLPKTFNVGQVEYVILKAFSNTVINDKKIEIDSKKMIQFVKDINNGLITNTVYGKAIQYVEGEQEWSDLARYIGTKLNEKTTIETEIFNNIIKKFEPNATHIRGSETELMNIFFGDENFKPFGYFGYGLKRSVISGFLCAVNKDNVLGVDEAENGLHFDAHKTVIKSMIDASIKYNTQLFITTHSREYAKSFLAEIEQQELQNDFSFINLFDKDTKKCASVLNFDDLQKELDGYASPLDPSRMI
jgi:AAA15 family ATPase/GTPase